MECRYSLYGHFLECISHLSTSANIIYLCSSLSVKHKHIAEENVHVKVTNGESLEIGAVSVSLKDVIVDEKTVCSLHLDMVSSSHIILCSHTHTHA